MNKEQIFLQADEFCRRRNIPEGSYDELVKQIEAEEHNENSNPVDDHTSPVA